MPQDDTTRDHRITQFEEMLHDRPRREGHHGMAGFRRVQQEQHGYTLPA